MATPPDIALAPPPPVSGLAPPHNLEAEQSVLGAILLSERSLYALVIEEGLRPEDFYRERHRITYAAMLALYGTNEPIDPLTVTEALRQSGQLDAAGGAGAIDELTGSVPLVGNARRYAQIVKENALLRRLLTTTYQIQASVAEHRLAPRDLVEQAEKAMLEVAHDDKQQDFRRIEEILHDELDKMQRLSAEGTALTGTPSGFKDLDEITGGFQPGNLIIIAARPSMGKSALVTNIAENASIDHNRPVALFSLEMSETELAQRFVASQGRIFGDKLRKGRVADSEWPKILEATKKLSSAPLYVDDSSDIGILDIRAKARRLHQQAPGGLGLVIIDYLQLMRPDAGTESRVEQVGQMSRGLKILARELNVPVIALSQLSRAVEQRHDKKPILSDLRECVTGDTLVVLADGRRVPIRDLVGMTPEVVAVDEDDRVVSATSDRVWRVGKRPVLTLRLASGRTLRATADHRVRAFDGWRHMGELGAGDRVALSRRLPTPKRPLIWSDDHEMLATSTNVDTVPKESWSTVQDAMAESGVSHRAMATLRGTSYDGGAHVAFAPSRDTLTTDARLLDDGSLARAATSDLFWDRVTSVTQDGEEDVYDLTVPGPACWLADGIVTHNSGQIEQDADLVMFIYRDEYYEKDESESQGLADILIAKHRNGGLGDVTLTFRKEYPKFLNYAGDKYG
jgi:replicative DNA helicase